MPPSLPADPPSALDIELLNRWSLPVDTGGDKFSRGDVLVIGGSPTTPGAAILAGRAALRMGAGRLQIATHPEVRASLAVLVPEAKVIPLGATPSDRQILAEHIAGATGIVIGPGAVAGPELTEHLTMVLSAGPDTVVVVDAAAFEPLPTTRLHPGPSVVLTPNRQELDLLLGGSDDDDMASQVAAAAERFGAVVTSFGTIVAPDGRRWATDAGHPGLGTSGSGDVLAGLIAGVAARTGDAAQAACWGTLVHALAGERLGRHRAPLAFLAHELLEVIDAELLSPRTGCQIVTKS